MENKLEIKGHFNNPSQDDDSWDNRNRYYHEHLRNFFRRNIPPHKRVLDIGCGTGERLHCVRPHYGMGIDVSKEKIDRAQKKFPNLRFVAGYAERPYPIDEKFEYIIMCDLLDHVSDIWAVFRNLENLSEDNSRLLITTINPFWGPIFIVLERWGLKKPEGPHNFIFRQDIVNLLRLFGYEIEQAGLSLLFPIYIPLVSTLINRYLSQLPVIKNFCLVQYVVSRRIRRENRDRQLSCSVIIPCYNEAENVAECFRRIPQMGKFTEVIFVDDGSMDDTTERVRELMGIHERVKLISYSPNQGKSHAIRTGFEKATGDVLMILDADMTVMPEDLEKFFWAMNVPGVGFVNGTRMVYPTEEQAMRWLSCLGNKIFSLIFTWLLGQRITDTLCGTKAILRQSYQRINMTAHDQWGDFDLLLGAAKLGLSIVEMPVKYKRRLRGESKMRPFKHGFRLLLRCIIGFKELKLSIIGKKENAR